MIPFHYVCGHVLYDVGDNSVMDKDRLINPKVERFEFRSLSELELFELELFDM